jgi:hypothetical protein
MGGLSEKRERHAFGRNGKRGTQNPQRKHGVCDYRHRRSFLGARACTQMILDQYRNEVGHLKVYFAGWNLSGTYHKALLDHLKNEEISICVVSKSGKTAETLAAFNLFKKLLKEKYGKITTSKSTL